MKTTIALIAVYTLLYAACTDKTFAYLSPDLTVVACHGIPENVPENTFAAFERAVQLGANGIKIDVRKTKDGELILMHDPTIDRTTDGKGYVESLLYDEIQLYDAGSWLDGKYTGQKVPLLSDVLKFAKANNLKVVLDVKQQGIEDQILLLIKELDVAKQIYFWGSLWGFRGLESGLPGKGLVYMAPEDITNESVGMTHAEKKLVITTMLCCDNRESIKARLTKGVDVVLVDYPCIVKDILKNEGIIEPTKLKTAQSLGLNVLKKTVTRIDVEQNERTKRQDVHALMDIISGPDADKSRMAALLLAGYPPGEAVPPLVKCSKSWTTAARRNATWALGFVKDERAVEVLIKRLSDKDVDVRREAALGLKRQSNPAAVSALIEMLLHDKDSGVRFDAARALGEIDDRRVVYPLAATLKKDPDWGVRGACAVALNRINDMKAVEALGTILVTDTFSAEACWVREMAARALANIGKSSVETLIDALRDNEECTRRRASRALIRIGMPATTAVVSALHDPNRLVRKRAAYILGWIEDDASFYPLLSAIKDDEPMVRQTAAWALGRLGDPRAKDALKVTARDKNILVKETAREAVDRLDLD